jgi:hypothetical protein
MHKPKLEPHGSLQQVLLQSVVAQAASVVAQDATTLLALTFSSAPLSLQQVLPPGCACHSAALLPCRRGCCLCCAVTTPALLSDACT